MLFFGACHHGGRLYFCTEFAEVGSLYSFLREGSAYGFSTVKDWGCDVARGMEYLCSKNIVHRDLKSPNILLFEPPAGEPDSPWAASGGLADTTLEREVPLQCKICDFGLSHTMQQGRAGVCGTVRWMAPEALRGSADITSKSDVFGFGVVLWELVTRRQPFETLDDIQVIWAVAELGQRLPIPTGFPHSIELILDQCFADCPFDRPDWYQIQEAVAAVDTTEGLMAPPEVAEEGSDVGFSRSQSLWSSQISLNNSALRSRCEMEGVGLDVPPGRERGGGLNSWPGEGWRGLGRRLGPVDDAARRSLHLSGGTG